MSARIDVRRGTHVIFGCFIIFGASAIAAGIQAALFAPAGNPAEQIDPPAYPPVAPVVSSVPADTDPYAGAAVPRR